MLPSLFREAGEQGRSKGSFISMIVCMIVIFAVLIGFQLFSVEVNANFFWFLFCGFCLALSIIAPGMSFSTLLMPLGLYTPFVDGIGHFDMSILIPGGIGAVITVICLAKAINALFDNFYSIAFHGIIGIVIAATIMTIPFAGFADPAAAAVNLICIAAGIAAALALDRVQQPRECSRIRSGGRHARRLFCKFMHPVEIVRYKRDQRRDPGRRVRQ